MPKTKLAKTAGASKNVLRVTMRLRLDLVLRLQRLVADLRVQSLGLDLRGSMTTETTPLKRRPVQRNA